MLKMLIRSRLSAFERRYNYDAGYMRQILEISPKAFLRLQGLTRISGYRGPAPEIWAGALLASSLDGDCGPCAQLVADFALEAGVDPGRLRAAVGRDFAAAGDVGLGFRFAEAAIRDAPEAAALRQEIAASHGEEAVLAASFAAISGRAYPVLKRALGHGQACQRLSIGAGPAIAVAKAADAAA